MSGSSSGSRTDVNPSVTQVTGSISAVHRSIPSGSTPAVALASADQKSSQRDREVVVEMRRSECGSGMIKILCSAKLMLIIPE